MPAKRKNNTSVASTPKRSAKKKYSVREATILCTADPNSSSDTTSTSFELPLLRQSPISSNSVDRSHDEPQSTTNVLLGQILEVLLRMEERLIRRNVQGATHEEHSVENAPIPNQPRASNMQQENLQQERPARQPLEVQLNEHCLLSEDTNIASVTQDQTQHDVLENHQQEEPMDTEVQPMSLEDNSIVDSDISSLQEHTQDEALENEQQELSIIEPTVMQPEHEPQQLNQQQIPVISEERLRKLKATSFKPSSFAIALAKEYYTEAERSRNCCLRGRKMGTNTPEIPSISPSGKRLKKIIEITFRLFDTPDGDKSSTRKQIIRGIDGANRRTRKNK